jgi:hypothetical protein
MASHKGAAQTLFEHEMTARGVVASWDDVDEDDRAEWQNTVDVVLRAASSDDIAWFSSQRRLSLDFQSPVYADDDDQDREWRVREESGNINDREWEVIGRGATVPQAIAAARKFVIDREYVSDNINTSDAMYKAAYPWFGSSRFNFDEMYRAMLAVQPKTEPVPDGEEVREMIAKMFDEAVERIYEMRDKSPFHSVSQDALSTYGRNLAGWARQIRDMPLTKAGPTPAVPAPRRVVTGVCYDGKDHNWTFSVPAVCAKCGADEIPKY